MSFLYQINLFLWSGPLLILLIGLHIYHSIHYRFPQRRIAKGIKLSLIDDNSSTHGFSTFGSFATTLAATLGTGNIIGMSTAVFLGGPGAVLWCWLTGILGMATTYAETYICNHFRQSPKDGEVSSGPMYILSLILHKKWLAYFYATALCLSAFCIGCTTQSNAIVTACRQVTDIPPAFIAIIISFLVGLILMQGTKWIEVFSIAVVPAMALFFAGGCVLYLFLHWQYIAPSVSTIVLSAFRPVSLAGGIAGFSVGQAVRYGVARGLFTNEAGLCTSGVIAAHSNEKNPDSQALVSMSATFWDTVVLCGITGIVLVAFLLEFPKEILLYDAGSLLVGVFQKLPFFGDKILIVAIVCFAIATLVGWSFIGKQGFFFLFSGKGELLYSILYIGMIFVGGILPLTLIWELTDFINLFLLIPSVYLLIRCRNARH